MPATNRAPTSKLFTGRMSREALVVVLLKSTENATYWRTMQGLAQAFENYFRSQLNRDKKAASRIFWAVGRT